MDKAPDLKRLGKDIKDLVYKYGLSPRILSVSITLHGDAFDSIAPFFQSSHPEIIRIYQRDDVEWQIQILKLRELKDFPSGAILEPPPDD